MTRDDIRRVHRDVVSMRLMGYNTRELGDMYARSPESIRAVLRKYGRTRRQWPRYGEYELRPGTAEKLEINVAEIDAFNAKIDAANAYLKTRERKRKFVILIDRDCQAD